MKRSEAVFVMFALHKFDAPYSSSAISICKELAKTNRVFFISNPRTWKDLPSQRNNPYVKENMSAYVWGKDSYRNYDSIPEKLTIVTCPFTLPMNFLDEGKAYDALYGINSRIVMNTFRRLVKDHNLDLNKLVYINSFNPFYATKFPKDLRPAVSFYRISDDISQNDYTGKHGPRLENKALAEDFDFALATGTNLKRIKSQYSDNIHLVHNAADFSIFEKVGVEKLPRPKELEGVTKTIIGYTGNISLRINYPLLKKIAEYHHDKIILMVGPIDRARYEDLGFEQMDNVIFTGAKHITELPNYLQYIDCTMIPFKCNTLTKGIYPLKINEYLAAGKAAVATNFSEDIKSFEEYMYLANTDEEFLQMIDQAIAENSAEKEIQRRELAKQNTWGHRIEEIWEIIEAFVESNKEKRSEVTH